MPLTFVEEYLGEVHSPWRWFEIQVRASAPLNSSLGVSVQALVGSNDLACQPSTAHKHARMNSCPASTAPCAGCDKEAEWGRAPGLLQHCFGAASR